jgi:hypothetical protein
MAPSHYFKPLIFFTIESENIRHGVTRLWPCRA